MRQNRFTTKDTKGAKEKAKMHGRAQKADLISDEVLESQTRGMPAPILGALRGEGFLSDQG